MSQVSVTFLKMQLLHFQACERFFQAPIDLEMLKNSILAQEENEEGGSEGSSSSTQHYTDFLLSLPEHLQPTEIGMPDPNVIKQRRQEKGMNTPIREQEKNVRNALKAQAELKNQLKNRLTPSEKPKYQRRSTPTPVPRPSGFSKNSDES